MIVKNENPPNPWERERKSFLNFAGERRKKSLLLRREMMMMISSTTLTTAPKSVQRVPKKVRRHHRLCVFLPIVLLLFEFFFASKTGVFSVQSRVSGSDFKRSAISFSCISLSLLNWKNCGNWTTPDDDDETLQQLELSRRRRFNPSIIDQQKTTRFLLLSRARESNNRTYDRLQSLLSPRDLLKHKKGGGEGAPFWMWSRQKNTEVDFLASFFWDQK